MLANMNMNYLTSAAKHPGRAGNAHPNIVPYQVFAAADGHVIVAVGNDAQFAKFCAVAGAPRLGCRRALRAQRRPRSQPRRAGRRRSKQFCAHSPWRSGSKASTRPASRAGRSTTSRTPLPIRRSSRAALRVDLPHPLAGTVPLVGTPLKMSASPPALDRAPPTLGQHTEEVLREVAGIDATTLAALRARGIV